MRHSLMVCGVLVGLCLSGCTAESGDVGGASEALERSVYHSVMNGGGASLYGGDGSTSYWLDVWENGDTVFLNYAIDSVDPTSEVCVTETFPPRCPPEEPCCDPADPTCGEEYTYCYYTRFSYEYGWGEVPASDFRVSNQGAQLRTTVASGPTFWIERCTVDYSTWSWECSPAGGGAIDLAWTGNRISSGFNSGVQQYRWGKYASRWSGQWRSASADASGILVGHDAVGMGAISSGRTVQIDIMPASEPPPPM